MDLDTGILYLRAGFACGKRKTCSKKERYNSEKEAKKLALVLSAKYEDELEHYPCIFCGQWHIGHKKSLTELSELADSIE